MIGGQLNRTKHFFPSPGSNYRLVLLSVLIASVCLVGAFGSWPNGSASFRHALSKGKDELCFENNMQQGRQFSDWLVVIPSCTGAGRGARLRHVCGL